jgi:predicted TIM-barrel fold metal-dependent hydrolase
VDWASNATLTPYMSDGWRTLVTEENLKIKSMWQNQHPLGNKAPGTAPRDGPPGSDPELLIRQLLDERGCERVVLGHQEGLLSTALPLPYMAKAATSAINEWVADEWLARDDRLFGQILVTSAMPDEAAAEIRRLGENEKFVAVALGANGLNKPFGHPAYFPIFEAAVELNLPVVIQVGADNVADAGTSATSVGPNVTYAEYDAMSAGPLMPHLISIFTSGLFDLHPSLRVLAVGGGLAWVPQFIWRLDWNYKLVRRVEVPWVHRMPSEYFAEHVRLSTYTLEKTPKPEQLATIFELIPGIESMLVYTSGYPNGDGEDADSIAARVPEHMHDRVFHDNAMELYRWPGESSAAETAGVSREEIVEVQSGG